MTTRVTMWGWWRWYRDQNGLGRFVVGESSWCRLCSESHRNEHLTRLANVRQLQCPSYSWRPGGDRNRRYHSGHRRLRCEIIILVIVALVVCIRRTWVLPSYMRFPKHAVYGGRRLFWHSVFPIPGTISSHNNIFDLVINPAAPWSGHGFRYVVALVGESPSQSSGLSIAPPDIIRKVVQRYKSFAIEVEIQSKPAGL
jgi:hypothetical protein